MITGYNGTTETGQGAGRQVKKFTVVQWLVICQYLSHCIPDTGSYQYFLKIIANITKQFMEGVDFSLKAEQ